VVLQSPRLPPELEREIFEIAALTNPTGIVSLLCVARRVFEWLLLAVETKPPAFFAAAVRHMIIHTPQSINKFDTLISLCTGTTHLAIGGNGRDRPVYRQDIPNMLARMPSIQHLITCLGDIFPASEYPTPESFPLRCFAGLTHLAILDVLSDSADTLRIVSFVSTLPSLTHLAVFYDTLPHSILTTFLERCPRLLILCWLVGGGQLANRHAHELLSQPNSPRDARLVIATYGDWYEGVELPGIRTFWDTAEEFVERKRRGQVNATRLVAELTSSISVKTS
ncbi:hypothetical protein C8F01DRAFT_1130787, partial [Mycena amicta]